MSTGEPDDRYSQIFGGLKLWFSHYVPSRKHFIDQAQLYGAEIVKIDKQADVLIHDHARKNPAPGLISYTFIEQSIKNGRREDLENHRIGVSSRVERPVGSVTIAGKGGRTKYTAEDDRLLRDWVDAFRAQGGSYKGNEIYKQLEARHPHHPYQSWRDRYLKYVSKQPANTPPQQLQPAGAATRDPRSEDRDVAQLDGQRSPKRRRIDRDVLDLPQSPSNSASNPSKGTQLQSQRQQTPDPLPANPSPLTSRVRRGPRHSPRVAAVQEQIAATETQHPQADKDLQMSHYFLAQGFTVSNAKHLLRATPSILICDEEKKHSAWEAFAANEEQSVLQWINFFESIVLPAYKRREKLFTEAAFEEHVNHLIRQHNADQAGDAQEEPASVDQRSIGYVRPISPREQKASEKSRAEQEDIIELDESDGESYPSATNATNIDRDEQRRQEQQRAEKEHIIESSADSGPSQSQGVEPRCCKCFTKTTSSWRWREGKAYCSECAYFAKAQGTMRPSSRWSPEPEVEPENTQNPKAAVETAVELDVERRVNSQETTKVMAPPALPAPPSPSFSRTDVQANQGRKRHTPSTSLSQSQSTNTQSSVHSQSQIQSQVSIQSFNASAPEHSAVVVQNNTGEHEAVDPARTTNASQHKITGLTAFERKRKGSQSSSTYSTSQEIPESGQRPPESLSVSQDDDTAQPKTRVLEEVSTGSGHIEGFTDDVIMKKVVAQNDDLSALDGDLDEDAQVVLLQDEVDPGKDDGSDHALSDTGSEYQAFDTAPERSQLWETSPDRRPTRDTDFSDNEDANADDDYDLLPSRTKFANIRSPVSRKPALRQEAENDASVDENDREESRATDHESYIGEQQYQESHYKTAQGNVAPRVETQALFKQAITKDERIDDFDAFDLPAPPGGWEEQDMDGSMILDMELLEKQAQEVTYDDNEDVEIASSIVETTEHDIFDGDDEHDLSESDDQEQQQKVEGEDADVMSDKTRDETDLESIASASLKDNPKRPAPQSTAHLTLTSARTTPYSVVRRTQLRPQHPQPSITSHSSDNDLSRLASRAHKRRHAPHSNASSSRRRSLLDIASSSRASPHPLLDIPRPRRPLQAAHPPVARERSRSPSPTPSIETLHQQQVENYPPNIISAAMLKRILATLARATTLDLRLAKTHLRGFINAHIASQRSGQPATTLQQQLDEIYSDEEGIWTTRDDEVLLNRNGRGSREGYRRLEAKHGVDGVRERALWLDVRFSRSRDGQD